MKSEPEVYSIKNLKSDRTTWWEGVRNYQARNFMMKDMSLLDSVFFYHSSCDVPGVYGIGEVSALAEPDQSQFNNRSPYFDPKATLTKPIWFCTQIKFVRELKRPITLSEIRMHKELEGLTLLKKGSRLSVQPVVASHGQILLEMVKA